MRTKQLIFAGLILGATGGTAVAHHGWAWTEPVAFTLKGKIEQISLGNPHAILMLAAADGQWFVELAPSIQTRRAGFVEGVTKVGDTVEVLGFRARDHSERHMKGMRVVVNGKNYDVYPDQLKGLQGV